MSSFSSFAERFAFYESIDKFYLEKQEEAMENAGYYDDDFDEDEEYDEDE